MLYYGSLSQAIITLSYSILLQNVVVCIKGMEDDKTCGIPWMHVWAV